MNKEPAPPAIPVLKKPLRVMILCISKSYEIGDTISISFFQIWKRERFGIEKKSIKDLVNSKISTCLCCPSRWRDIMKAESAIVKKPRKLNQIREDPMKRRTFVKGTVTALPAIKALGAGSSRSARSARGVDSARSAPSAGAASSPELEPIALPKPDRDGGKSVLAALQIRKTTREISPEPLPQQTLSDLLWAAFGVNRPEPLLMGKPGRTAASASNSQEIDLYVSLPQGVYLYEAVPHRLAPVAAGDFRVRSGRRQAVEAPVNIFYIVDLTRYVVGKGQPDPHIGDPEVQKSYYYVDTGLIAQNVYLFAAAHGLAAWFHNCDKENTPREFKLRPTQRVLFAQSVGYPKKP